MRFINKKALVTGSSRGIGRAIAYQLASEGAEVIIHYKDKSQEALEVVNLINETGGKSQALQADLSDTSNAIKLAEDAWRILGGIDILINNAGVSYKRAFIETSTEDFDHFTQINFKSVFFLTQSIAKRMIENKVKGSIYTITSVNAIQPGMGFSAYGATKGALETLMKGVALELASSGIKVNTLAIGAIKTDINAPVWQDKAKLNEVESNIPLGRIGFPEEVAAVLCDLLISGTYITGSTINIDGGWLL